jgi:hypothetical protein
VSEEPELLAEHGDWPGRLVTGGGRVLDSDALSDFATIRTVYTQTLTWFAVDHGVVLAVPAAALAAAWPTVAAQREVLNVLLSLPVTVIDPLDDAAATGMGELLAANTGVAPDVVAAHVAYSARRRGWPVVTTRPERLRALVPDLEIEYLP